MSVQATNWRNVDTKITKEERRAIFQIVGGIMLFFLGIALGAFLFTGDEPFIHDVTGYWTNLGTEVLGISVTVLILDQLTNYRRIENLKKTLVRNTKKRSNDTVLNAIDDLRHYGWLMGEHGLLKGEELAQAQMQRADLQGANLTEVKLQKANLTEVNLEDADMPGADLQGANLTEANLENATLIGANLGGAILEGVNWVGTILTEANLRNAELIGVEWVGTNLQGAVLSEANLRLAGLNYADLSGAELLGAILTRADLQGATLTGANLEGAILQGADLPEADLTNAILPNGETYSDNINMRKFTEKIHPKYDQTLEQINALRKQVGLQPW